MSGLSFLLNFKGHCTSMGWCFQSHAWISDQLNSGECKPAWHNGCKISQMKWVWMTLVPHCTLIYSIKQQCTGNSFLLPAVGGPQGVGRRKKFLPGASSGWWPKVRCDPQQWVGGCYDSHLVQLLSHFLIHPKRKGGKGLCTCYLMAPLGSVSGCEICSCSQQCVGKQMMLCLEPWRSPWSSVWTKQPGHGVSISGPEAGKRFFFSFFFLTSLMQFQTC